MADDKEREGTEIAPGPKAGSLKDTFKVFDPEANNTVDVRREIGTIIRLLGCCPREGELHDLTACEPFSQEEMEEMLSAATDPESNSIRYKDYIAMMVVDDG
ncbi:unnamed protein product [Nyctereutes procyonoides]|uniref:(raccoon dog) hypothetical protein n=1 Tax=Nyctereutes procyonoides TaxID=34880 RepID=A0A811XYS5_NYCPR|nr:unnamed protein product [Nyctereutes procyonoides]